MMITMMQIMIMAMMMIASITITNHAAPCHATEPPTKSGNIVPTTVDLNSLVSSCDAEEEKGKKGKGKGFYISKPKAIGNLRFIHQLPP